MVAGASQIFYCQFYQWRPIEVYIYGYRVVARTWQDVSPVMRAQWLHPLDPSPWIVKNDSQTSTLAMPKKAVSKENLRPNWETKSD